jgi:hypothetical protein
MIWRCSHAAQRLALCLAGSALAFVVTNTGASAEQMQAPQPAISLEPSTGLEEGDTVTVSGSGFSPEADIGISMCAAVVTSGENCDFSGAQVATTDATGSFTKPLPVVASITTPADGTIDCAPDNCGIGAANLQVQTEVAAASFSFADGSTSTTEDATDADEEAAASEESDDDESAASTSEDDDGLNPILPLTLGAVIVVGGALLVRRIRGSKG